MATIVLRAGKALPLTHNEVDANFRNLNNDKLEIGAFQLSGNNTKIGVNSLISNTTGVGNTASGSASLISNTTGGNNTASGVNSLFSNTTGGTNTASGVNSLYTNTTGGNNTASGVNSLFSNTTGDSNTASGVNSLYRNTTGENNTAIGVYALFFNTTGGGNTASGASSLSNSTTGVNNSGFGANSLGGVTTGSGNIGIGPLNSAGTFAPVFNTITENNRIAMGSTAVTNAYIQVAWTVVSDKRDKTNFAPVPHGLSFVNALKPTAYQFKYDRESTEANGPLRYGFLAQDILELEGPDSVIIDAEDPEKLRYNGESLVPVLVNAIQELSAMVEALRAQVAALS